MFRAQTFSSLILSMALLAPTAAAGAQDEGWHFRFGGVWVDPDVNFTDVDSDGDRVAVGASGEIGFSLALERRFNRRLGVELGVLWAEPDLNLDVEVAGVPVRVSDVVGFTAITAGLNIHLTPDKPVDLYVAPLLVYTSYGDLRFVFQAGGQTLEASFRSDDDYAFGAQVGADVAFGESPWSLALAARYLDTSLSVVDEDGVFTELNFDPLILSVGFGYRF